jgi:hypothetical protein
MAGFGAGRSLVGQRSNGGGQVPQGVQRVGLEVGLAGPGADGCRPVGLGLIGGRCAASHVRPWPRGGPTVATRRRRHRARRDGATRRRSQPGLGSWLGFLRARMKPQDPAVRWRHRDLGGVGAWLAGEARSGLRRRTSHTTRVHVSARGRRGAGLPSRVSALAMTAYGIGESAG